jgi:hypothetical protein
MLQVDRCEGAKTIGFMWSWWCGVADGPRSGLRALFGWPQASAGEQAGHCEGTAVHSHWLHVVAFVRVGVAEGVLRWVVCMALGLASGFY